MNKQYFLFGLFVALAFLAGGVSMWAYHENTASSARHPMVSNEMLDDMFDDRFFARSRDPFQEMERMRERMDRLFRDDRFSVPFDRWFDTRFGNAGAGSISMEEDDDRVVYRIDIGDRDLVDLKVDVEAGYMSVEGKLEYRNDNGLSVSQFHQRFPLPANVDAGSAQVEQEDGSVVISLHKSVS